uniref:Uncharacterized protein n=1 Tax=Anguilla anguilla TaxID=7936 RepID=A0A0E9SCR0_ANGAN
MLFSQDTGETCLSVRVLRPAPPFKETGTKQFNFPLANSLIL